MKVSHYSKSQIFVQKFNFDKTPTFSRVFTPKKIDNCLGKSKLNFWTKNEDFKQCVVVVNHRKCLILQHYKLSVFCLQNGASFGKSQLLNGASFGKSKQKQNYANFLQFEIRKLASLAML